MFSASHSVYTKDLLSLNLKTRKDQWTEKKEPQTELEKSENSWTALLSSLHLRRESWSFSRWVFRRLIRELSDFLRKDWEPDQELRKSIKRFRRLSKPCLERLRKPKKRNNKTISRYFFVYIFYLYFIFYFCFYYFSLNNYI